jgi:hypothetical protein
MSQAINGVLYVDSFTATGNPGEYTFENATYNNQNDSTGIGALIIDTTFVLFAPIVDPNTFIPLSGLVGRYKFTNLTYIDTTLISGTILYDQDEAETGVPGNGIYCLVSKVSTNLRLATPPIDTLYTDLQVGGTVAAMMNDLINIVDKTGNGSSSQSPLPVEIIITSTGQTVFTLPFTPVSGERTVLILNGVIYHYGITNDYTITGDVLTWINSLELEIADKMVIR